MNQYFDSEQLEELAQTLHDKTTDEQECSADFAELLRGVLSCEWLYGLKAFSNIILDMDVARFWFTEKQHQHFRAILVSEFPKFQQEMVRMLALVYLRNTVPSEQIGDVFLEMWKAQISLLAPVGEIVWELHHMLRRGEIKGSIAANIRKEIKELAKSHSTD